MVIFVWRQIAMTTENLYMCVYVHVFEMRIRGRQSFKYFNILYQTRENMMMNWRQKMEDKIYTYKYIYTQRLLLPSFSSFISLVCVLSSSTSYILSKTKTMW